MTAVFWQESNIHTAKRSAPKMTENRDFTIHVSSTLIKKAIS